MLAGGGALPLKVAESAAACGHDVLVIVFSEAALADYRAFEAHAIGLGQIGALIDLMRAKSVEKVVLTGKIQRPDFRKLKLDRRGAQALPGVLAAAARGDDRLIAHMVRLIESEGFKVVAPESIASELAASAGLWTRLGPEPEDLDDIAKGMMVAKMLGQFDIGQGAVVDAGLVLALEAAEGTDAMLDRVAHLPPDLRNRGVLVKCMKPGQERRVDLPAIGPETIRRAAGANLKGIAIEAGNSIVVDRESAIGLADALGLFLIAMSHADLSDRR